jgi:hypothetical protein
VVHPEAIGRHEFFYPHKKKITTAIKVTEVIRHHNYGPGGLGVEMHDSAPAPKSTDLTVSKFSGFTLSQGLVRFPGRGEHFSSTQRPNDLGVPLNLISKE